MKALRSSSASFSWLKEFAAKGGRLTLLKGAQLEEFLKLDREKTEPET